MKVARLAEIEKDGLFRVKEIHIEFDPDLSRYVIEVRDLNKKVPIVYFGSKTKKETLDMEDIGIDVWGMFKNTDVFNQFL